MWQLAGLPSSSTGFLALQVLSNVFSQVLCPFDVWNDTKRTFKLLCCFNGSLVLLKRSRLLLIKYSSLKIIQRAAHRTNPCCAATCQGGALAGLENLRTAHERALCRNNPFPVSERGSRTCLQVFLPRGWRTTWSEALAGSALPTTFNSLPWISPGSYVNPRRPPFHLWGEAEFKFGGGESPL